MLEAIKKKGQKLRDFALRRTLGVEGFLDFCLFRNEFVREVQSVRRGLTEHSKTRESNEGQLRRNIHRIEKGLVMKPFRFPFGLDYITETVAAFTKATQEPKKPVVCWAESVLNQYFSHESKDHRIVTLRASFQAARLNMPSEYLGPYLYQISEHSSSRIAFESILNSRASLRHYSSLPISRESLKKALDMSTKAPSACNRQPFRYEVFLNCKRASELASISIGTGGYADGIKNLAFIIGDLSNYEYSRDRHLIYIDGGLSAMCFVLSMQSQGIGTCCINWPDQEPQESQMKKELSLKPWEKIIMLVAFGYPADGAMVPFSQKKEVSQISTIHDE